MKPWLRVLAVPAAVLLAMLAACGAQQDRSGVAHARVAAASVPAYDHIFVVMEENRDYSQIVGSSAAPYLNSLLTHGASASNMDAVTHPSANNYLADVSGQTYTTVPPAVGSPISDSCTPTDSGCSTTATNLFDEIEASGRTWGAYMEDMPSACYTSHNSGNYVERHNPVPYFSQIRDSASRCANDKPYAALAGDLGSAATTPNFVWITPNLQDDMHNGTIAQGDAWAKSNVPQILGSPAWTTQRSLLVIAWDENASQNDGNHIPFIALSSDGSIAPGTVDSTHYTMYSFLRTVEDAWGLPPMHAGDSGASDMSAMFTGTASPSPTRTSPSSAPTGTPPPQLPVRAAFVYPWYPENWSQGGTFPKSHWRPVAGYYSEDSKATVERQITELNYGRIQHGILSWWGPGSKTDQRVGPILADSAGRDMYWSLYYEPAYTSQAALSSDLSYIYSHYAPDPHYWVYDGKPVLFVYSRSAASCTDVANWMAANAGRFFIDAQVFAGDRSCPVQASGWHQYSPAARSDEQAGYSYTISPGFWKYDETRPRLARSVTAFRSAVAAMVASKEPFQLVTTFNEWNEGTAVEPATAWASPSGYGQYLDVLHAYPTN